MFRWTRLLFLFLLIVLPGCTKKDEGSSTVSSKIVSASEDFKKYYGGPPEIEKGRCNALVVYIPTKKDKEALYPLPVFFVGESRELKKLAVETFFKGFEGDYYLGFLEQNLYRNIVVNDVRFEGDSAVVVLSKKSDKPAKDSMTALFATLNQFNDIKTLKLYEEETLLFEKSYEKNKIKYFDLTPPQVVSFLAIKEEDKKSVEDISLYFDRPVNVDFVEIKDSKGNKIEGEYFRSVFNMAVVFKPKDLSLIKPGNKYRVSWKVHDNKERTSEATTILNLIYKEHK